MCYGEGSSRPRKGASSLEIGPGGQQWPRKQEWKQARGVTHPRKVWRGLKNSGSRPPWHVGCHTYRTRAAVSSPKMQILRASNHTSSPNAHALVLETSAGTPVFGYLDSESATRGPAKCPLSKMLVTDFRFFSRFWNSHST